MNIYALCKPVTATMLNGQIKKCNIRIIYLYVISWIEKHAGTCTYVEIPKNLF